MYIQHLLELTCPVKIGTLLEEEIICKPTDTHVACAGTCSILAQTDFPSNGHTLNNGKHDITASDQACCDLCSNTLGKSDALMVFSCFNLQSHHSLTLMWFDLGGLFIVEVVLS